MKTTEDLVLSCVESMLLMPAVEHMTAGDVTRAVSMIEASHSRPANGRVEATAMWLTAVCIRFVARSDWTPGYSYRPLLDEVQRIASRVPATREQVSQSARAWEDQSSRETTVQLAASALALAIEGASSRLIAFSEKDRATCAREFKEGQ